MSDTTKQEHRNLSQDEWEEEMRQSVIAETTKTIELMRASDPRFNLELCEHMLEVLYANQGDSWIGKGYLMELKEAARITAYELYIQQWKDEIAAEKEKEKEEAKTEQ